jgi:hypothetical protein
MKPRAESPMPNQTMQAVECRGCCQFKPGACGECLGHGLFPVSGWFRKRRSCARCGGTGNCPGCQGSGWIFVPTGEAQSVTKKEQP